MIDCKKASCNVRQCELNLPRSLMTFVWSNSFIQAASRRKSSISERVQMATGGETERRRKHASIEGEQNSQGVVWILKTCKNLPVFKLLDMLWSWHYHGMIHQWSELYMCQCFIQAESLSVLSIKNEIIGPKTCELLTPGEAGLTFCETACVSKYEGIHCLKLGSLLTLHRLDSDFEDGFLLSQQPLHHWAKFSWRNKCSANILDAVWDATLTNCLIQQKQQSIYQLTKCRFTLQTATVLQKYLMETTFDKWRLVRGPIRSSR